MTRKQLIIVASLMALCSVFGWLMATDWKSVPFGLAGPNDVKLGAAAPPVKPSNEVQNLNDAFVAVSKAVTPQVVSITVTSKVVPSSNRDDDQDNEDEPNDPFGFFRQFRDRDRTPMQGSGSGVIITPDGYILTNNHVVEFGEHGSIVVDLSDGRSFDAKLIGRDSLTDLAVVKIDATDLPVAAFGNSDEVQVGQLVLAVGNPLGLTSTVTQGIVSALGRGSLQLNKDRFGVEDFIQTDAAINPGNSGGGLFDLHGALVGINSAIATRTGYYQGYGFAIPINLAHSVAQDLIDDGHVNRGYIGVSIKPVNATLAKALKFTHPEGALVTDILKGSPAEKAGLLTGDVILQVDGQEINTPNHLQSIVARKRAGDPVKLKVFRDGSTFEKDVTLRAREESDVTLKRASNDNSEEIESDNQRSLSMGALGMELRPLDPQTKRNRSVENGVMVGKVEMYGEAMSQGLQPGDIIVTVNKKPVSSPADFKKIIDASAKGDVLLLQVKRRNGSTELVGLDVKK
ncbi:MAG TPA: Do family serine endopeptidase [Candidatus Kapabacteria bacterium]|nr:Do family serine endopeptidase [Candidatus Kapabacteria bacterium]